MLTAWKEFEPTEVVATTYQAISGAGKTFAEWPEMVENIIPFIGGEEEKSEQEPLRIWGQIKDCLLYTSYTKLSTVDNRMIVIPNGALSNNSLTNVTAKEKRRLEIKVDVYKRQHR